MRPILAAGGILTRNGVNGLEVLAVRRNRYGDLTLPKGKLQQDGREPWQAAALREVREETGYDAVITGLGGTCHYRVNDTPKIVLFFTMTPVGQQAFSESEEVREPRWLSLTAAEKELSYASERQLVTSVVGNQRLGKGMP